MPEAWHIPNAEKLKENVSATAISMPDALEGRKGGKTPIVIKLPIKATPTPQPTPTSTLTPTPTPTPILQHPTITETLQSGITYIRAGFKIIVISDAEAFTPVEPPEFNSVEIEQALFSEPWLAAIGPLETNEQGLHYRTIILSRKKGKATLRWWGEVDENGIASTVVSSGMPRPKSEKVKGMIGTITHTPPGSAYPYCFKNQKRQRFGITSNKTVIRNLLDNMTEADGRIQVWGELRYAVDDCLGRRILVDKYDLKDVDPETILGRTPATPSLQETVTPEVDEDRNFGPIALIYEPKPHSFIRKTITVTGEIIEPVGNQIVIQVENEAEQVLGSTTISIEPQITTSAPFTATLSFADPPAISKGRIAVYAPELETGVLQLVGWQEIRLSGDAGDKQATILKPTLGATIRQKVRVVGQATNIPNDFLLVRVEDLAGVVMGKSKAKIDTAGNWQTVVQFRRPRTTRPGVIAVYVVNANDKTKVLLTRIPVKLKR